MTDDQEKEDENVRTKTFNFYIMYNWKKGGKPKLYKNDPEKKAGPHNIVEEVEREIILPEKTNYKSSGEIEIGKGKMKDMVIENM